ncbi:MAG: bifunctional 5,10-methylenetetrahydrofolate dehydrogenase/5,10-methenyltetrahydrofolate cyclohydrolase [Thermomicrobiales bacterium]|nr:bifunctional 5,10-methylenetetrahydrofolate dehydrogenase/5,10-methenyltetrahydrofolate cyclohydrolase [Thermomicrobiales bacterium]
MTALVLRGAPVAREIRERTRAAADLLRERVGVEPTLATLRVGADAAAGAYRGSIERLVAKAGVRHLAVDLDRDIEPARLIETLHRLNADPTVHGVLLLMPLPPHLPLDLALEHLSPLKDVDGITPLNAGRLHLGLPALRPSTPQGGLELLDHYGIAIAGTRAVVVGRSNVVGSPMAALLTARDATVTVCHRQTVDLAGLLGEADLVVLAAGSPGLLHGSMLREGAVVLDFGINVIDDTIVGDADAVSVAECAAAYTPVPGGAGPVTTMVLARNTVAAAFASLAATADLEASQVELVQELVAPV